MSSLLYIGEKEALALCRRSARVGKDKLRQWREEVPDLYVKFTGYDRGRYVVPVLEALLRRKSEE